MEQSSWPAVGRSYIPATEFSSIMSDSDTKIGSRESQTGLFRLVPRQALRVVTGPLAGVRGTFSERRAGGLVLLQVGSGMYVEVLEICLQPEEKA